MHYNGKKRPSGPFPSLPSGMDKILKIYCDKLRVNGKMLPQFPTGIKFFKDPVMTDWQNNFRGIQWMDKKSGILLRGAVDEMLMDGKKLVVLDFKTRGYPCKDDTHKHYELQINLYNLLLQKNGYKTADYGYLLFYYPKNMINDSNVKFSTELKKMKVDIKMAEKVFRDAVKCLKGPEPKNGHTCCWCVWENGELND